MTIKELKKANDILDKLRSIDRILNNTSTDFNDDAKDYDIIYCVNEFINNEVIELLKNKRIELQNEFNKL